MSAVVGLALGVALSGCDSSPPPAAPSVATAATPAAPPDVGQLGQPRADLTPAELAAFNAGRELFLAKLPKLGPTFNDESCGACHFFPTVAGGGSLQHAAFIAPSKNEFEPYHRHALPGYTVPARPANVSHRIPPPLYGMGLIEQIPDATIRAACGTGHPVSAKQQGSLPPNQVARFGAKPFVGTVPDFVDAALLSEAMVTTPLDKATDGDAYPDPEVDTAFVLQLAAFVRGLQAPARNGNDAEGEAAFQAFGCASCHVQHMEPARNVFSDFCVHAMGADLADGIVDHEAQGDEFRTTPLWGLRFRTLFLHDGRATTLEDAIQAHGGEGAAAAKAFREAPPEQRAALMRFLATL